MNIEIKPYAYFGVNEHDYGSIQIRLLAYRAAFVQGEIRLVDHDEYRWATRSDLKHYEFAPADIPFVEQLELEYTRK